MPASALDAAEHKSDAPQEVKRYSELRFTGLDILTVI